jgi:hypothetical protein
MPYINTSNISNLLKELYNPLPPWYIAAHKAGTLTELDKLIYAEEIAEYKDYSLKDLFPAENPFLKLMK